MNHCLYCNKPCGASAVFCDECRTSLLHRHRQREKATQIPSPPSGLTIHTRAAIQEGKRLAPPTPLQQPPPLPPTYGSRRGQFAPRSPFLEVEEVAGEHKKSEQPASKKTQRSRPEPVITSKKVTAAISPPSNRRRPSWFASSRRLQGFFIALTIVAVLLVVVDGFLVHLGLTKIPPSNSQSGSIPLLTIIPQVAHPGDHVQLQILHFPALAAVLLSHDVQEVVKTDRNSPLIQMSRDGDAAIHMLIDASWKPGDHLIEGEDLATHYTASTTLRVTAFDPKAAAPRLQISQTTLDMGADSQGTNANRQILLRNLGGGSISWTAKSHQDWLFFSPNQGNFSNQQHIFISVSRAYLQPGNYSGVLTLIPTFGASQSILVSMEVLPTSVRSRPIIVVTPPAFSFTTTDRGTDPDSQTVTLRNPGSQPLPWSLSATPPPTADLDASLTPTPNWVSVRPASGTLAPGAQITVSISVYSYNLLPDPYSALLTLTSAGRLLVSPLTAAVASLTVKPYCRLATSTGLLTYTAISGQSASSNQSIILGLNAGCAGIVRWQAFSSAGWLFLTPNHGQLNRRSVTTTDIKVDPGTLRIGIYSGFIVLLTTRRTQTLMVQLRVIAGPASSSTTVGSPAPSSDLMISPAALHFSATPGGGNPAAQIITISANGNASIAWQATGDTANAPWLSLDPTMGSVTASQAAQLLVSVDIAGLNPGTYSTRISLATTSGPGQSPSATPQIIPVLLTIQQACVLQVVPTRLAFTASALRPDPAAQQVTLKESGDCSRPVSWNVTPDAESRAWLRLSPAAGIDSGSGGVFSVSIEAKGILLGHYSGSITLSASDSPYATVQGSPQTISVTLTVLG